MGEKTIFLNSNNRVFLVTGETNDWYIGRDLSMQHFESLLVEYLQEIGYQHIMLYGGQGFRGKYVLDENSSKYVFKRENDAVKPKEPENIPLELKPEIVYDDFDKIDLRVGTILEAEKHPKADKLLVFQVQMGTEKRQIISGVAEYFKPEEMVGKKVIVVANLKPRQLRGMESKGLLLFADNGERLEIVTTTAEDGNAVS